jgi:hypothetical protein
MSFWSSVENFFKQFAHANWAHTASVALSLAGPPAILILQETLGPANATEASAVLSQVQTDLATVAQLLAQAQTGDTTVKGRIVSLLQALQANLTTLLNDAHVKNSANAQKITNLVNAFVEEITVVLAMIPA